MRNRTLTFYVPGLISPAKSVSGLDTALALDGLVLLLSRARRTSNIVSSYDGGLFDLFDFSGLNNTFPVAPVARLIDGNDVDGSYWLRADPVHLQPNRDQIVMLGNAQLNVQRDEAAQLQSEFNALFAEDGLHLETPVNHRWYLKCATPPQICTTSLEEVLWKNIDPFLPKGSDALYWHKLLNEAQMLFFNSDVNQRRRQEGKPEINSIWMWGGGCLPDAKSVSQPSRWRTVWGNDVVSRGLAVLYEQESAALPECIEDWLENSDDDGDHLMAFDGAQLALSQRDIAAWKVFMGGLEDAWISPAIKALKEGHICRVSIVTDGDSYALTAKDLRRWWKKRRPLSRHG